MKIWILNSKKCSKTYEIKRFEEEAKNLWIKLRIFFPEQFDITVNPWDEIIFYKWKPIKSPDVLIARNWSNYFQNLIIKHFEKTWVLTISKSYPYTTTRDKMLTMQRLHFNKLPVPKSIFAKFPVDVNFIEEYLNFPLIIKKTEWSQWKWIILCENKSQFEDIIEMIETSLDNSKINIIFQEFISEKKWEDIRVFVVWGRVIWAILRKGQDWDFKANYSSWWSVMPYKLNKEIEWLSLEAVKCTWLDIAWVDLLFDKKWYRICEVNSAPWFQWFEEATWINVAKEILEYAKIRFEGKGE